MKHVRIGYDIVVIERTSDGDRLPMPGKVLCVHGPGLIDAIVFNENIPNPFLRSVNHADDVLRPGNLGDQVNYCWRGLGEQWGLDDAAEANMPAPPEPFTGDPDLSRPIAPADDHLVTAEQMQQSASNPGNPTNPPAANLFESEAAATDPNAGDAPPKKTK